MNAAALVMEAGSEVVATPVTDRRTWDYLFALAPRPAFTQSWCYGEGKIAEGWKVERLMFTDGEGVAALCQLLVRRPMGLRVTRINRGPVFLREPTRALHLAVMRELRRQWRFGLRGPLLLAPSLPAGPGSSALLREAGFWRRRDIGWTSSYLDLQLPLEQLHKQLASDWRTKIRRATRLGVTLRLRRDPAAIEWMLDRHVENMRDKDFIGPSPQFVRRVCAASPADFWLLQAMIDGEPEAGLLVGRFGQHAENFIAWFSESARKATAGNFLMWNSVIEAQRLGCRTLDLGGYSISDRYGHFKRGMRGIEYSLAGEWLAI